MVDCGARNNSDLDAESIDGIVINPLKLSLSLQK